MFKPTPSLNSRLEARLRGWRGPAVGILRRENKRTDPLALDPPFAEVPHCETQRALPAEKAYAMMGLPMPDILEMRGGTRRAVEKEDVLLGERVRGVGKAEPQPLELSITRSARNTRPQGPYRRRVGNAEMTAVPKVNPMRYKPPATNHWRHSIYAYNKETIKNLPSTTANSTRLVRAYLNMVPKEHYAQQILTGTTPADAAAIESTSASTVVANAGTEAAEANSSKPTGSVGKAKSSDLESMSPEDQVKAIASARADFEKVNRIKYKEHKTDATRVFISDRGYVNKGMIRQDALGKISRRMQPKTAFHYPYRAVQDASSQITFKHWRGGIGVSVHVHEGEEEEKPQRRRA